MPPTYPLSQDFDAATVSFRLMKAEDRDALLAFAQSLPESDLIYLRMDITQPEIIDEWVENLVAGKSITVFAEQDGEIIGYGTLHINRLMWTRHIGEIRVMVDARARGGGVGRSLATQLAELAREQGLFRVVVQLPADQPRVRNMFEELGFEPQAILPDWLKDRHNRPHDLVIMSKNVVE